MDKSLPGRFAGKPRFLFRGFPWLGPAAGAVAGYAAGAAGAVIGFFMGFLVQELVRQFRNEKSIAAYFENPGRPAFAEADPGMAAYCALGLIILARSMARSGGPFGWNAEDAAVTEPVLMSAAAAFPRGRDHIPELETYCRLAASRVDTLNEDLLVESLAARRTPFKDLDRLGRSLERIGFGPGRAEAEYIRSLLDPGYRDAEEPRSVKDRAGGFDPWKVLGLRPGSPMEEVKSTYRRLAVQFHPDALQILDRKRQAEAARAFMTIREAYRVIAGA
ncbi:MAG: J domain-containing protein [Spirochaetaceae bacterium]|jgi:DnaJ like chaperone protein|nr:J domain-containing protein [Spirochaetaceae bacterium]